MPSKKRKVSLLDLRLQDQDGNEVPINQTFEFIWAKFGWNAWGQVLMYEHSLGVMRTIYGNGRLGPILIGIATLEQFREEMQQVAAKLGLYAREGKDLSRPGPYFTFSHLAVVRSHTNTPKRRRK